MKLTRHVLISLSIAAFSTTLYAAHQYADLTKTESKKKSEPVFAAVAPGSRVLAGEQDQDEFYVLGKNDPDPVKPKTLAKADSEKNSGKKVDVTKVEVNKAYVYKVEVNKVAVNKPEIDNKYIAASPANEEAANTRTGS